MTWSVHPARERPLRACLAVVVIILLAIGAGLFGGSIFWGLGAVLLMVAGLNCFLFPSTFSIDADGVEASYLLKKQRLAWNRIRRFLHDDYGGYLSTRAQRSWTDGYRGIHVLFGDNSALIVNRINAALENVASQSITATPNDSVRADTLAPAGGQG